MVTEKRISRMKRSVIKSLEHNKTDVGGGSTKKGVGVHMYIYLLIRKKLLTYHILCCMRHNSMINVMAIKRYAHKNGLY